MRLVRLTLLAAAALAPFAGCSWMERMKGGVNGNGSGGGGGKPPLQPVSAEQLVGYLNAQSTRLQTVAYGNAIITAKEGLIAYPSLRGNLVASQPRYFHMTGNGTLAAKIDLGSNPDEFWMYLDAPRMNPTFVFASHSDFEQGRARIPGGIPFEPDWVMQALGLTTFPTGPQYEVKPNDRDRTYTLAWDAKTPTNMPVRKEIVFAAEDADSGRDQPQVRRHVIKDARGGKVICTAEVKSAKTVTVGGTDPRTGHPFVAQYPMHIVLRWEEQKFEMDLQLKDARVNPSLTPEQIRNEFSRPRIPGATPIDLARYDAQIK